MSVAARRKGGVKKLAVVPGVVFDTRVLLRALLFGDDQALRLRQAWQLGRCRAFVDAASARALMRALAHPGLALTATQQHELLADYLPYAEVLQPAAAASKNSSLAGFERLALGLARAAPQACLVSDSQALKTLFARPTLRSVGKLLTSEDFLAGL